MTWCTRTSRLGRRGSPRAWRGLCRTWRWSCSGWRVGGSLRRRGRIGAGVGSGWVGGGGVGDDMVHTYFAAGAEGFTSSVAGFMPDVALELFRLASGGEFAAARELFEEKVAEFYALRAKRR